MDYGTINDIHNLVTVIDDDNSASDEQSPNTDENIDTNDDQLLENPDEKDTKDEVLDDIFGTQIDDNNPRSKLYLVEPEQLVKIKSWDYNRQIDQKHVENLYKGQKKYIDKNGIPYFAGNFIIGKMDGIYRVLDGQHRIEVVKKLLNENITHFMPRVEIIEITDDEEMVLMFKNINNTKPLSMDDMPEGKMVVLMELIDKNYKKIFSQADDPLPPNINRRTMMNKIKEYNFFDKYNVTPIKVFQIIQKINTNMKKKLEKKYGEKAKYPIDSTAKKLFIKEKGYYLTATKKGGFVLGIDRTFEWLVDVEIELENSCPGNGDKQSK